LSAFVSIIENIDGVWLSSAGPLRRPWPSGWNGSTLVLDATGGTANLTTGNTVGFAVQAAGHLAKLQKWPILQWHERERGGGCKRSERHRLLARRQELPVSLCNGAIRDGNPYNKDTLEAAYLCRSAGPRGPGC
jgi:hypothetical protein